MLEHFDYMLLEKINKYQPITEEELNGIVSSKLYGIHSRLIVLISNSYIGFETTKKYIGYGLEGDVPTDKYVVTDIGAKTLQDYKFNRRDEKLKLWLSSFWIPLLVSLVTTLILNKWSDILQWLILIL